jgi:hypothetical protein
MKRSSLRRNGWLRADPARTRAWHQRSRKALVRHVPLRDRNPERIARKRKAYAARLRKSDWKLLKYLAYQRSNGLCECETCAYARKLGERFARRATTRAEYVQYEASQIPVAVWFVKGGGAIHLRMRGGSLHHVTYARFGSERLEDVRFMHVAHHAAVEREHGTRRRYLAGKIV